MRHKGNLERYIRDIYKKGSKQEREKAEEARQIASIDAAAAAAMGISVAQASTSGSATTPFRRKAASSSTSGSSYSTAASLGFTDLEAEKLQKEKELRDKEGHAGEWELVAPTPGPSQPRSTSVDQDGEEDGNGTQDATPQQEREEVDNRQISHKNFKEKSLPVLDDDDYDQIKIKVRSPKPMPAVKDALAKARQQAKTQAPASEAVKKQHIIDGKNKFKAVELKEYEETPEEQEERYQAALELIEPKGEHSDSVPRAPSESSAPMFKKRKAKSGDAASENKRRA